MKQVMLYSSFIFFCILQSCKPSIPPPIPEHFKPQVPIQSTVKKKDFADIGFAVKMRFFEKSQISVGQTGYIFFNDKIVIEISRETLYPTNQKLLNLPDFQLAKVEGGFVARFKVKDNEYRCLCFGDVTETFCAKVLASVQIILPY